MEGQMNQMNQVNQLNQLNQLNRNNQTNQMNQVNQMNQMNLMNQLNQMNQTNVIEADNMQAELLALRTNVICWSRISGPTYHLSLVNDSMHFDRIAGPKPKA